MGKNKKRWRNLSGALSIQAHRPRWTSSAPWRSGSSGKCKSWCQRKRRRSLVFGSFDVQSTFRKPLSLFKVLRGNRGAAPRDDFRWTNCSFDGRKEAIASLPHCSLPWHLLRKCLECNCCSSDRMAGTHALLLDEVGLCGLFFDSSWFTDAAFKSILWILKQVRRIQDKHKARAKRQALCKNM